MGRARTQLIGLSLARVRVMTFRVRTTIHGHKNQHGLLPSYILSTNLPFNWGTSPMEMRSASCNSQFHHMMIIQNLFMLFIGPWNIVFDHFYLEKTVILPTSRTATVHPSLKFVSIRLSTLELSLETLSYMRDCS